MCLNIYLKNSTSLAAIIGSRLGNCPSRLKGNSVILMKIRKSRSCPRNCSPIKYFWKYNSHCSDMSGWEGLQKLGKPGDLPLIIYLSFREKSNEY